MAAKGLNESLFAHQFRIKNVTGAGACPLRSEVRSIADLYERSTANTD
jgi:hypothetical protein